jgi:hypothetical protein
MNCGLVKVSQIQFVSFAGLAKMPSPLFANHAVRACLIIKSEF